ncbi:UPF0461 protein C5orf24 homolog [Mastomys coucha]|uniref:UPF0461 protein C5orf24 homolog n=1 Tax=Mastomys coucha TaxID=35658 RepID=UPI001262AB07|nr:UPF0461 protein C5orf24 homolog [Mastomys coucha]
MLMWQLRTGRGHSAGARTRARTRTRSRAPVSRDLGVPAPAPAPARAALTFRGWGGLFLRRPGPAVRAPGSRALAWPSPPPPALCRDWTGPPGAGAAGANGPGGSFPAYGRPLGALRAGLRAAEKMMHPVASSNPAFCGPGKPSSL